MNVLTASFFYDFSRYFHYLEKSLNEKVPGINFFNISIYPCAHHYWKKNKLHSVLLPFQLPKLNKDWADILKNNRYKDFDLDQMILFNFKSQKMYDLCLESALKKQAIRYIDYFDQLFQNNHFDIFISSGDTRMIIEIAVAMASAYNIKTFFFEQGPFGTTIIDHKGVNTNISFYKTPLPYEPTNLTQLNLFFENYRKNKPEKYWSVEKKTFGDRLLKFFTFVTMYTPFLLNRFIPPDLRIGLSFKNAFNVKIKSIIFPKKDILYPPPPNKKYILLLLQIPVDAQLINNSPLYKNFTDITADVVSAIPNKYSLIIREHPNYRGLYDPRLYKIVQDSPYTEINNRTALSDLIMNASVVIVNNSTAGLEALSYYKTVITLGDCYYNKESVVYHLKKRKDLKKVVEFAIQNPIKQCHIEEFLYNLIFKHLIIGHFQDSTLLNGHLVAQKILSQIND